MRQSAFALLYLSSLFASGCILDPNSKLNVNRGEYHDEYDAVAKEGRGNTTSEEEVDPLGRWMYSPEAQSINRHLGVSN
jgi:hypothetical protein